MGMASIRVGWVLAVSMLTACGGITISQPAPTPPQITARPGTGPGTGLPPVVLGGFIYPASGSPNTYEVDSALVTLTPATSARSAYFAFEINYHVAGARNISLAWRTGAGAPIPLTKIDSPCDASADDMRGNLARMRSMTLAFTGRGDIPGSATTPPVGFPASFSPGIDAQLNGGTPVWWITCNETDSGEVTGPNQSTVDYNVAILLPVSLVGVPGGGNLDAIALNIADAQTSPPTTIAIVRSPIMIGVVGDSMAWGQGVVEGTKYYDLFAAAAPGAAPSLITGVTTNGTSRLTVKAHSGAVMSSGFPSIAATTGCGVGRNPLGTGAGSGEVPNLNLSVPCEIQDLVRMDCSVALPPTATSTPDNPVFTCGPGTAGTPGSLIFDLGPRFDFVMIDGCINDLRPGNILLGTNGYHNASKQTADTLKFCDVRKSIPDIKAFLPVAAITHIGYHSIFSTASDMSRLGCTPPPPLGFLGLPPGPAIPLPSCAGFTVDDPAAVLCVVLFPGVQSRVAARAALFRADSNAILRTSIGALDTAAASGRARYIFVSPTFTSANAFLAPASQTWGLNCSPPFGVFVPLDPVAGQRAASCSLAINPTGSNPNSPADEECKRASAMHPDTTGQATINTAIRTAHGLQGLLFSP